MDNFLYTKDYSFKPLCMPKFLTKRHNILKSPLFFITFFNIFIDFKLPCIKNLLILFNPYNLFNFQCQLVFESYSFNTDEVRLLWHDVPVTMMENVELPDFDLIGWSTDHQRLEYPNGVWDRAQVCNLVFFLNKICVKRVILRF